MVLNNIALYNGTTWHINFILRLESFWIGVHYSFRNQSYCIGLLPCVILRIGKTPYHVDEK